MSILSSLVTRGGFNLNKGVPKMYAPSGTPLPPQGSGKMWSEPRGSGGGGGGAAEEGLDINMPDPGDWGFRDMGFGGEDLKSFQPTYDNLLKMMSGEFTPELYEDIYELEQQGIQQAGEQQKRRAGERASERGLYGGGGLEKAMRQIDSETDRAKEKSSRTIRVAEATNKYNEIVAGTSGMGSLFGTQGQIQTNANQMALGMAYNTAALDAKLDMFEAGQEWKTAENALTRAHELELAKFKMEMMEEQSEASGLSSLISGLFGLAAAPFTGGASLIPIGFNMATQGLQGTFGSGGDYGIYGSQDYTQNWGDISSYYPY